MLRVIWRNFIVISNKLMAILWRVVGGLWGILVMGIKIMRGLAVGGLFVARQ